MSGTVDSHVHLWDVRHTPQPWMTQEHAAIARPFGPGDLRPLLEQEGIDAAVVVQGHAWTLTRTISWPRQTATTGSRR